MELKELLPWKALVATFLVWILDLWVLQLALGFLYVMWKVFRGVETVEFGASDRIIVLLLVVVLVRRIRSLWKARIARKKMDIVLMDVAHALALDGHTIQRNQTVDEWLRIANNAPDEFTRSRPCLEVLKTLGFGNLLMKATQQGKAVPINSYEWWLVTR